MNIMTDNLNKTDWRTINSSPWNFQAEVRNDIHAAKKIYIHDTTLRDGEQFPGVTFNKEDKIRIGRALSECGVHRIELMPAVSDEDFEAASALSSMGLSSEIVGFCRSVKGDVQKSADSGCKAIQLEITTFPPLLKASGWSFEDATGKMIETSHFAKEKGLRVSCFFMAATQTPPEFLEKFVKKVLAEGALDAVSFTDTLGTCLPQALYHLVRKVKSWTDKPVEIHAHNTYNLGAAGALAGVMAGAEVVHASVNGLGEGCGNAPLEAVAMDLELMLGIDSGIKLEKLYELSQLVQDLSGIPVQANYPLMGARVFDTEAGIAVDAYQKMIKAGVSIPTELDIATKLGRVRGIQVGKMSGTTSIELKMMALGIENPGAEKVREILTKVKKKSIELRRTLTDGEFTSIARG